MTFGNYKNNSELQIKIEGVQIENATENKFLGLIIDNNTSTILITKASSTDHTQGWITVTIYSFSLNC